MKKPPDTEKPVLTWIRESRGLEYWQIDTYNKGKDGKGFWFEASAWHDQKVVFWRELPPRPTKEELG